MDPIILLFIRPVQIFFPIQLGLFSRLLTLPLNSKAALSKNNIPRKKKIHQHLFIALIISQSLDVYQDHLHSVPVPSFILNGWKLSVISKYYVQSQH